jgi:hypothetical protein
MRCRLVIISSTAIAILFKAINKGYLVTIKAIDATVRVIKKGKINETGGLCGLRIPAFRAHKIM